MIKYGECTIGKKSLRIKMISKFILQNLKLDLFDINLADKSIF